MGKGASCPAPPAAPLDGTQRRLIVPSLLSERASPKAPPPKKKSEKKKKKNSAHLAPEKMRGHFQRQAVHRERNDGLLVRGDFPDHTAHSPASTFPRERKPGVGIMRNGNGYTRVNPFSCSGRCNMANRDMGLSEFLAGPVTWQERHGHFLRHSKV